MDCPAVQSAKQQVRGGFRRDPEAASDAFLGADVSTMSATAAFVQVPHTLVVRLFRPAVRGSTRPCEPIREPAWLSTISCGPASSSRQPCAPEGLSAGLSGLSP